MKLTKRQINLLVEMYNTKTDSINTSDFNKREAAASLAANYGGYFSYTWLHYNNKLGRHVYRFTIKYHLSFIKEFLKGYKELI